MGLLMQAPPGFTQSPNRSKGVGSELRHASSSAGDAEAGGPVVGEIASILLAAVKHRQNLQQLNDCLAEQRFIVCRGK